MLTSTECRDNERVTRVSSGKRRECLWQKKTDERVTDEKVVEIVEEVEVFCELLDLEDDETEVEGVVVQLAKTVNVAISENKYFFFILNTFYFASK